MNNDALSRMKATKWSYAEKDPAAMKEIEARVRKAALEKRTIHYSDLVEDIAFHLPNLHGGKPFEIDVHNWRDIDRGMVGEFLGYLSMGTYERHGFLASTIVVGKEEQRPSQHFFDWMRKVGLLSGTTMDAELEFWVPEMNKTFDGYASGA